MENNDGMASRGKAQDTKSEKKKKKKRRVNFSNLHSCDMVFVFFYIFYFLKIERWIGVKKGNSTPQSTWKGVAFYVLARVLL